MREEEITGTGEPAAKSTHSVLVKAYKLISAYAQATGSMVCVHDQNYMPIPEMFSDIISEKNICLYCTKYRRGTIVNKLQDLHANPCNDLHINAMKEATNHGNSYTYTCELGFVFWTSPIYLNGVFVGSLLGTGYIAKDLTEASKLLSRYSRNEISEEEFRSKLSDFPRGDPEKIKALEELLRICAESLSSGGADYHETSRRRAGQQERLSSRIEELKIQYPAGSEAPGYPFDKEQSLLAALRRGENEAAGELLNDIMATLVFSNKNDFRYIQFRAVELVVLLSRADINPGHTDKSLLVTNNYYIKQIQESKNVEELTDVLYSILDRKAGQILSFQGVRHAFALRKAERYILENFSRKISLQEIAGISGLSAPYFSTIFKEERGENLSKYLNRLRVEKSSRMLLNTDLSLSEIASACGFEDQSWFSKIFKTHMGISPGKYRSQGGVTVSEISENNVSKDYLNKLNQ
ncbi:MAG: helix-turn-helix domain-containing protein [Treponema sp.]|jgi:AraC-like DNA-binding protein/ligand-binding sensor protein|nr:helix-turn-helix domain-containing protein [Treponema sp.]